MYHFSEIWRHNIYAPLLTNVRFDRWQEWVESLTTPISASLRCISERSLNLTLLELHSTEMRLNADDDYHWLMSDSTFPRLAREVLRLDAADITDSSLRLGAGRMGSLKRLELCACVDVSGDGILKFVEGRNQSFELLIEECPDVKPKDLRKLKKNRQSTLKSAGGCGCKWTSTHCQRCSNQALSFRCMTM